MKMSRERMDEADRRSAMTMRWPILAWRQCHKCKDYFRRERLWHVVIVSGVDMSRKHRFLCTSCADNREQAWTFFAESHGLAQYIAGT